MITDILTDETKLTILADNEMIKHLNISFQIKVCYFSKWFRCLEKRPLVGFRHYIS